MRPPVFVLAARSRSRNPVDVGVPGLYGARLPGVTLAIVLTAERPEHREAIERVLDRAFGPGRHAKTSERVRERGAALEPALSRVALSEAGEVVGVCRIWAVKAGAPAFFLGPLAVDPAAQSGGLGLKLAREAVSACRAVGGACVIVVGAASFFGQLGFSAIPPGRVIMPGPVDPTRFLWLELRPGGLDGVQGQIGGARR